MTCKHRQNRQDMEGHLSRLSKDSFDTGSGDGQINFALFGLNVFIHRLYKKSHNETCREYHQTRYQCVRITLILADDGRIHGGCPT